jgi:hypothetical protein
VKLVKPGEGQPNQPRRPRGFVKCLALAFITGEMFMTTKQIRARGMNGMIRTMQHLESKARSHGQRTNAELIADPGNILEKVRVSLLYFLQKSRRDGNVQQASQFTEISGGVWCNSLTTIPPLSCNDENMKSLINREWIIIDGTHIKRLTLLRYQSVVLNKRLSNNTGHPIPNKLSLALVCMRMTIFGLESS